MQGFGRRSSHGASPQIERKFDHSSANEFPLTKTRKQKIRKEKIRENFETVFPVVCCGRAVIASLGRHSGALQVLYDISVVSTKEPFHCLVNQSMILGQVEYKAFRDSEGDPPIWRMKTASLRKFQKANGVIDQDQPNWNLSFCCCHLFAPHIAEELWSRLGHTKSLAYESWPEAKEEYWKEKSIVLPVQMHGKLGGTIEVTVEANEEMVFAASWRVASLPKF